jgi:hypothetical protein
MSSALPRFQILMQVTDFQQYTINGGTRSQKILAVQILFQSEFKKCYCYYHNTKYLVN